MPTLKDFWRRVVKMSLAISSNLLLVLYVLNLRSSCQPKIDVKTLFSHPLSITFPPVILTNATVVAFLLLCSFSSTSIVIHSVSQRLLKNRSGSGSYDLSRLHARNIMKGIHSGKPAPLNRPIAGKHIFYKKMLGSLKKPPTANTVLSNLLLK